MTDIKTNFLLIQTQFPAFIIDQAHPDADLDGLMLFFNSKEN